MWDKITETEVRDFEHVLNSATCEEDIQQYLQNNPIILVQRIRWRARTLGYPKKKIRITICY